MQFFIYSPNQEDKRREKEKKIKIDVLLQQGFCLEEPSFLMGKHCVVETSISDKKCGQG